MKKLDAIKCASLKDLLNTLNEEAIGKEDVVNILLNKNEYVAIFYCETKK